MTLSDKDLAKIRAALGEAERARQRIDRLVGKARATGATWTEVGFALGMTAQGAQKRYGGSQERADAYRASAEASAARRKAKRSSSGRAIVPSSAEPGAEPWPDGTVQDTIGESGHHGSP